MGSTWRPMLASLADAPLTDPHLIYEPKYDGIRAIIEIEEGRVRLWSRLGNDKSAQFPEIVKALQTWARRLRAPVILDGEIIALDVKGHPAGFQQLQRHTDRKDSRSLSSVAFVAFDVLRDGPTDFRGRPFTERRAALERIFGSAQSHVLRISEVARGDGRALYQRAMARGWEGLIAKRADSRYKSGKRTPDWRKLKIVREQEFVVAGWTEPRQTRSHFGALLLGVYEDAPRGLEVKGRRRTRGAPPPRGSELVYVAHVGTGFEERELARLITLLRPLETKMCPFREPPPANERAHWVKPELVAQVKFMEWTSDGRLRHPVYIGLRDDKKPTDIGREDALRLHSASKSRFVPDITRARLKPDTITVAPPPRAALRRVSSERRESGNAEAHAALLIKQLTALEHNRRDGILLLPDGDTLNVGNLHKVFWPEQKLTKGDLLRYYVQVSPFILPAVLDRPLTMKRFPNGVTGQTFYQHRAPDEVPSNVRVEQVPGDDVPTRLVGGNLKTLLYMTQLASISQDPWFSRVASLEAADHVALDLDPALGVPFGRVLDVARWIRDELAAMDITGVPKTSGADGLHIYIPLPPGTSYEAGLIFCQIVAEVVAHKHPAVATVERSVRARGTRVYIDCFQNILGKTLATAYSARASGYAGVSAPLSWDEVDRGVRREDFTIETMPARLREVGDLWKALRTSKGIDLARVLRHIKT